MSGNARAAFWFAAAAVAQALWIATIAAGNEVAYDHWAPAEGTGGALGLVAFVGIAAQGIAAGFALVRGGVGARIAAWVRVHLGLGGVLFVAGVLAATTAHPHRDPIVFVREWAGSLVFRAVQLATLALAIDALGVTSHLGRWASESMQSEARWLGIDRVAFGSALFVFVAATALVYGGYEAHPHVPDEVAYLWQAEYFAQGRLRAPLPPVPEAFAGYLIDCDARGCASPVPPGWPALLALGSALGLPWLVNPLLGALAVLAAFSLVRRAYDTRTARLVALLLAASPWLLLTSMSLMTHVASLLAGLLAALAAQRLARGGSLAWCGAAGALLGAVAFVRPLEGVIASAIVAAIAFARAGTLVQRATPVALAGVVAAIAGGLQLAYNAVLTGRALPFPINAYTDRELGPGVNGMGFGPDRGVSWGGLDPFPGHGLRDVVVNSMLNATAINQELFAWAIGSLVPAAIYIALRRRDARDALALATIALVVVAHAFYWFSGGPDFGARYWFLALPPLVLLSARGLLALDDAAGSGRVIAAAFVVSAFTLAVHLPWRALDKYRDYRGMRPDVRALRDELAGENALVLVRGKQWPDFASAQPYNAIDVHAAEPVFAWDRDAATRARLLAAFPEREVIVVNGPSLTGDSFARVEGPLAPGTPIATPPTPAELLQ
jgi:hypothetical protein